MQPLTEPVLVYCQLDTWNISVKSYLEFTNFHSDAFEMFSAKWQPFYLSLNVLIHQGRVTHICVTWYATVHKKGCVIALRWQSCTCCFLCFWELFKDMQLVKKVVSLHFHGKTKPIAYIVFSWFQEFLKHCSCWILWYWYLTGVIHLPNMTWWCHCMEMFPALLAFCEGNRPVTTAEYYVLIANWKREINPVDHQDQICCAH